MSAEKFLEDAVVRVKSKPLKITVRKLLEHWGAKRRGSYIVDRINRDLARNGLPTNAPITQVWLDDYVTITRADSTIPRASDGATKPTKDISESSVHDVIKMSKNDTALHVGILKSARANIVSVRPDDELVRAQTLMMRHDYSQLAVLSGPRDLRGAVSWESIAQAQIRDRSASLRDAIVPTRTVRKGDDLLALVPTIVDEGFVFVQEIDRTIVGIVTTADLSNQFADLAGPYFMLGEIERRLRQIVDSTFTADELKEIVDPRDSSRTVRNAGDLTIGEHVLLFGKPERWERLSWKLDRRIFIEILEGIRKARNEIMHFSPDPLEPDDLQQMHNFLKWIRKLH